MFRYEAHSIGAKRPRAIVGVDGGLGSSQNPEIQEESELSEICGAAGDLAKL